MAWHFTAPTAAMHVNVGTEVEARLGTRGRLHVIALAWDDAASPRPAGEPQADLRYRVFGQGMGHPAWLEPPEAISVCQQEPKSAPLSGSE
jgi:hypothetical protein